MKYINGKCHLCPDCGTSPCKYHDDYEEIDGWDAEYIPRDSHANGGYYRVKRCPHFTDGSDCSTCANFTKCKLILPYGETCERYTRRAKKSSRDKMVEELKNLSLLMTPDECEIMTYFLIGLSVGDMGKEYSALIDEAKRRIHRIKIIHKSKMPRERVRKSI